MRPGRDAGAPGEAGREPRRGLFLLPVGGGWGWPPSCRRRDLRPRPLPVSLPTPPPPRQLVARASHGMWIPAPVPASLGPGAPRWASVSFLPKLGQRLTWQLCHRCGAGNFLGEKLVCVTDGQVPVGAGHGKRNKSKVYNGVLQATKLHKVERSEDNLHGFCFLEGVASELSLQYKAIQKWQEGEMRGLLLPKKKEKIFLRIYFTTVVVKDEDTNVIY